MTVYVDRAEHPAHGRWWAHLVSDHSLAELHDFAARLEVPRRAFEGDHYDVPAELLPQAVALGAHPVDTRRVLRVLRESGLRTPKRRGEKVLASSEGPDRRTDLVRCARVPESVVGHVVLHAAGARRVAQAPDQAGARVLGFRRHWVRAEGARRVEHEVVWTLLPPGAGTGTGTRTGDADGAHQDPEVWWAPLVEP
ncbi:DUF4031 domain-containing protein [Kineococcus gynurae]|uniref:DUF4031 domain-containing protein n=1 Tax=Kineococcus gynurae TaxID=452979 RepID=A0ABV5LWP7_9ACTN